MGEEFLCLSCRQCSTLLLFLKCLLGFKIPGNDCQLISPQSTTIEVVRINEMIDNWRGSWTFYRSNAPCSYNKNRVEKNVENMPPDVSVLRVKLSRKRRGMWAAKHLTMFLCVVLFNWIPCSDWVKFLIHAKKTIVLFFLSFREWRWRWLGTSIKTWH